MCYWHTVTLCLCILFFFFKQKTAYEMRISDWSSDVCSSDPVPLSLRVPRAEHQHRHAAAVSRGPERLCRAAGGHSRAPRAGAEHDLAGPEHAALGRRLRPLGRLWRGRALAARLYPPLYRKTVGVGKGGSVWVNSGGSRHIKK